MERFSEVVEHLSKAEARESHLLAQLSAMQADNQALHEQLAVAQKHWDSLVSLVPGWHSTSVPSTKAWLP